MNFCGTCGEQVRAGWVFCEACGMSLRAAAGGEATAQYSVPIPARKEPDRPRSQDPDPWRRPTPVPPPAVEAVTELPVTRRSNLPVARALAIVLAMAPRTRLRPVHDELEAGGQPGCRVESHAAEPQAGVDNRRKGRANLEPCAPTPLSCTRPSRPASGPRPSWLAHGGLTDQARGSDTQGRRGRSIR